MTKVRTMIIIAILFAFVLVGASFLRSWPPEQYEYNEKIKNAYLVMNESYPIEYELPKDEVISEVIKKSLKELEKKVSIIKYLLKNDLIEKVSFNGSYTGYILFKSPKMMYHYDFTKNFKKIRRVEINFYKDSNYRMKFPEGNISVVFYVENQNVKRFSYGKFPYKVTLYFYNNKKLKKVFLSHKTKYYNYKWDEKGKIVNIEISDIPVGLLQK